MGKCNMVANYKMAPEISKLEAKYTFSVMCDSARQSCQVYQGLVGWMSRPTVG